MRRAALLISGVSLGLMGADGWFVVPNNFGAVMRVGGRTIEGVFEEGVHLKLPVVATVQTVHLGPEKVEVPITNAARTRDGKRLTATVVIDSTVAPNRLVENVKIMGPDLRWLVLVSATNHAWANELRVRDASTVISGQDLPAIGKSIIDGAAQYGVMVASVDWTAAGGVQEKKS